jgi:hypothetical protein
VGFSSKNIHQIIVRLPKEKQEFTKKVKALPYFYMVQKQDGLKLMLN